MAGIPLNLGVGKVDPEGAGLCHGGDYGAGLDAAQGVAAEPTFVQES